MDKLILSLNSSLPLSKLRRPAGVFLFFPSSLCHPRACPEDPGQKNQLSPHLDTSIKPKKKTK